MSWEIRPQTQVFPKPIPLLLLLSGCLHRHEGSLHHMAVWPLATLFPVALSIFTLGVPQTFPQETFYQGIIGYFFSYVLLHS